MTFHFYCVHYNFVHPSMQLAIYLVKELYRVHFQELATPDPLCTHNTYTYYT